MYRKTYVSIDEKALEKNVKEIINKYNMYKYYIGVVKANAYGHGMHVVNSLINGGVNYLAVSSLEEAINIRKYNKVIPILCLEPVDIIYLNVIIINNVTITISDFNYFNELLKAKIDNKLKFHLKLDTGMSRLGVKDKNDVEYIFNNYNKNKNLIFEGIYTHLATSGINDKYYDLQINNFNHLVGGIDLNKIKIVHLGRSTTLVHNYKLDFVNGIRLGIVMYGFSQSISPYTGLHKIKRNILIKKNNLSSTILSNDLKLKTAFSLYSEVISIKELRKGDFVGYGASYIAKKDEKIAVLPIGYYDGMQKQFKYVFINDKKYEIVVDVCMDMSYIKVDDSVKIHDKVEIFGDNISIKEVAKNVGTSTHKLITSITSRVPRVYNDEEVII